MMKIKMVRVDDLKPYENNPRFNDDAVEYVKNSISEFGFKVPMVIDKDNVIVAGHTRYKASLELGLEEVPCIVADDLTEEQIKAFRLADNKVSEKADWNLDLLEMELEDLDLDMSGFGFDELDKATEDITDEVAPPSFNYKEQYGVIVMCKSEEDQEKIYNRLTEEGFECKVVSV